MHLKRAKSFVHNDEMDMGICKPSSDIKQVKRIKRLIKLSLRKLSANDRNTYIWHNKMKSNRK